MLYANMLLVRFIFSNAGYLFATVKKLYDLFSVLHSENKPLAGARSFVAFEFNFCSFRDIY